MFPELFRKFSSTVCIRVRQRTRPESDDLGPHPHISLISVLTVNSGLRVGLQIGLFLTHFLTTLEYFFSVPRLPYSPEERIYFVNRIP
jgi:hypothetical protein